MWRAACSRTSSALRRIRQDLTKCQCGISWGGRSHGKTRTRTAGRRGRGMLKPLGWALPRGGVLRRRAGPRQPCRCEAAWGAGVPRHSLYRQLPRRRPTTKGTPCASLEHPPTEPPSSYPRTWTRRGRFRRTRAWTRAGRRACLTSALRGGTACFSRLGRCRGTWGRVSGKRLTLSRTPRSRPRDAASPTPSPGKAIDTCTKNELGPPGCVHRERSDTDTRRPDKTPRNRPLR
mmetsp:Transcript_50199/g.114265  ORF Transcript_50199/g.114265 Transcript_50199/m.114265 type:complete len:233 (+) Transcript_50199:174-872(+)